MVTRSGSRTRFTPCFEATFGIRQANMAGAAPIVEATWCSETGLSRNSSCGNRLPDNFEVLSVSYCSLFLPGSEMQTNKIKILPEPLRPRPQAIVLTKKKYYFFLLFFTAS